MTQKENNGSQPYDDYKVPEYRVRLFLSVDLTGSTAYKHSHKNPLAWIKSFQKFYGDFPRILLQTYQKVGKSIKLNKAEIDDGSPKLWKTVGDEILFCCRIMSIHHLSACIESFIQSLQQFGESIKDSSLNTKGNAWVASFPIPNSSIMPITEKDFSEDSLSGDSELITEDIESKADKMPEKFDFLGKGIDSGFRISKNSSINALTISPGLGILLLDACQNKGVTLFKRKLRLADLQSFKGVAKGEPYPVLVIDVFRDEKYKNIFNAQNKLLGKEYSQDDNELQLYLSNFLEYYDIEVPSVKLHFGQEVAPPDFYTEYKKSWEMERNSLIQRYSEETRAAINDSNSSESDQTLQVQEQFAQQLADERTATSNVP